MKLFTILALVLGLSSIAPFYASAVNSDEESELPNYVINPVGTMLEGVAPDKHIAAKAFIEEVGLDRIQDRSVLSDIVPVTNLFLLRESAATITGLTRFITHDPDFLSLTGDDKIAIYLYENPTFKTVIR